MRVGPVPFPVLARDFKLFQLGSFCDQAAIGMLESQSDRAMIALDGIKCGSGINDVLPILVG